MKKGKQLSDRETLRLRDMDERTVMYPSFVFYLLNLGLYLLPEFLQ